MVLRLDLTNVRDFSRKSDRYGKMDGKTSENKKRRFSEIIDKKYHFIVVRYYVGGNPVF